MALAVLDVRGAVSPGTNAVTTTSWTSATGSLIVVIAFNFNNTTAPANSHVTDSKGNSYTLISGIGGVGSSLPGIAAWYQLGGTRGTFHTVTYTAPQNIPDIATIEITGHDLTTPIDTATKGNATDATSPYSVTAGGAIVGNQIAIYGVSIDSNDNFPYTQPGGYTLIFEEGDGASQLCEAAYKLNETGTPTVAASSSHSVVAAREIFFTVKEAVAAVEMQSYYAYRRRTSR